MPPASAQPGHKRGVVDPFLPGELRLRQSALLIRRDKLPPPRLRDDLAPALIALRFLTDLSGDDGCHLRSLTGPGYIG
jgi:hypothetical protein